MRPFLPLLSFLILVPGFCQDSGPLLRGPYLQEVTLEGATVVWHSTLAQSGEVRWGQENLDKVARESGPGVPVGSSFQHLIRIRGLKPSTTYRYEVTSGQPSSQGKTTPGSIPKGGILQFTTLGLDPVPFRFLVTQDIHNRAAEFEANLRASSAREARFVALLGDSVTDPESVDEVFSGFLDPAIRAFAQGTPLVFVRGNHEFKGGFARQLPALFPHTSGKTYFSFAHGGVHFTVLDTGNDEPGFPVSSAQGLPSSKSLLSEQARWLEQELRTPAATKARFRIVLMHIPPYGFPTNGDGRMAAASEIWEAWNPILKSGGIDLVLAGHIHRKYWIPANTGPYAFSMYVGPLNGIQEVFVDKDQIRIRPIGQGGTPGPEVQVSLRAKSASTTKTAD